MCPSECDRRSIIGGVTVLLQYLYHVLVLYSRAVELTVELYSPSIVIRIIRRVPFIHGVVCRCIERRFYSYLRHKKQIGIQGVLP